MEHGVLLVPGFLGFDHDGEVTYFADRFIAGLRATIEVTANRSVVVVPAAVSPTGSLATRQEEVLAAIEKADGDHGQHYWHILGHSTGGLDAAFLTRKKRLQYDDATGSRFSSTDLAVDRLRSVTALSAPHYGTCLARSALPRWAAPGHTTWEMRLQAMLAAPHLVADVLQRDALEERLRFMKGAAGADSLRFFYHLLHADQLARDLDATVAGALTADDSIPRTGVPIFSIATIAPTPKDGDPDDKLFQQLWEWARTDADKPPFPPALKKAPATVIASDPSVVPSFDRIENGMSDGIVNTNRQVFGEFAALVSADHGDVLGRYHRFDLLDGKTIDPGLLTSGAEFGDVEFFQLLRVIAEGMASEMR